MTPPQPRPQQHCDHECVCPLYEGMGMNGDGCPMNGHPMNPCKDDTRSRPHTSTPRPPCEECIYQSQSVEQIAAIRNATLDKFKEVIRMHDEDELLYPDLYNEFLVIYKSLRKEQP